MAAATITTKILGKAFMGISEFRFSEKSALVTAAQIWDYQVPILKDSCTFTQGNPTINKVFIHGSEKAYASTSETGEITLAFNVPSIDDKTTGWLYNKGAIIPASMTDSVNGKEGSWVPIGKGILMDNKVIQGMAMILSEDKKYAILIKNLKGYSSVTSDNISTTPIGFKVTMSLEGISEDTDGDVVFYEFKEKEVE